MYAVLVVLAIFGILLIVGSLIIGRTSTSGAVSRDRIRATTTDQKGYRIDLRPPHDREAPRNKAARLLQLLIVIGIVMIAPILFGALWGSFIGGVWVKIGLLAGALVGLWLFSFITKRLFIYVPEWSAYVTQDPFTGNNVPYGPGLHVSYLWEQRNEDGNEPMDVITETFTVPVQTTTSRIDAECMFQYAADLRGITTFIGNDASTIREGYNGFFESFLSSRLAGMSAEEARNSIGALNEELANNFQSHENSEESVLEKSFGIIAVSLIIKKLVLPAAVQKTRDAIDEAATMQKVVAGIYGLKPEDLATKLASKEISVADYNRMLNRAMAISENAEGEVKIIEGLENVGAAGALAAGVFAQSSGGSNQNRKKRRS